MTGIEIARQLKNTHPDLKILALSSENTASVISDLLDIGINGFISKRTGGVSMLADAIRSVMSGFDYYGKDISDVIYSIYVAKKKTTEVTSDFTVQEKNIILLCRDGLQSKQIADKLNISSRTVEKHKNNIFRKLGINNTVEMLNYALKNGIIGLGN
jgi:DNA-binding NarL/FixJ family response regulator